MDIPELKPFTISEDVTHLENALYWYSEYKKVHQLATEQCDNARFWRRDAIKKQALLEAKWGETLGGG